MSIADPQDDHGVPGEVERFWLPDWEMECCGDPLVVGRAIHYVARPGGAPERLGDLTAFGAPAHRTLTHHGPPADDDTEVTGTVEGLLLVRGPAEPGNEGPVHGTATSTVVWRTEQWDQASRASDGPDTVGRREGWLVDVRLS